MTHLEAGAGADLMLMVQLHLRVMRAILEPLPSVTAPTAASRCTPRHGFPGADDITPAMWLRSRLSTRSHAHPDRYPPGLEDYAAHYFWELKSLALPGAACTGSMLHSEASRLDMDDAKASPRAWITTDPTT